MEDEENKIEQEQDDEEEKGERIRTKMAKLCLTQPLENTLNILTGPSQVGFQHPVTAPIRVAIIGTSGRQEDLLELDTHMYDLMQQFSIYLIEHMFELLWTSVHLVSGGSAWCDHLAVRLYLENRIYGIQPCHGLSLYLPCQFITSAQPQHSQFEDTGQSDWNLNPGRTLNQLHHRFSQKIGRSTMHDITCAHVLNAVLNTSQRGFHARNNEVAKCDYMIAFTWSHEATNVKEGGTQYTWNKCTQCLQKVHVPLPLLRQYGTTDQFELLMSLVHVESPSSNYSLVGDNVKQQKRKRAMTT